MGGMMPSSPRTTRLPPNLPPRLICREAAAEYAGISPSKFDEMVRDGRMPRPRRIDSRVLWDVNALNRSIDNLPGGDDGANPWDEVA